MSGLVKLNNKWLRELDAKNKGELGEAIVETHLRSILRSAPERFVRSIEPTSIENLRVRRSTITSYNITSSEQNTDVETWTPDVSLMIEIYGPSSEMRTVLTEVKTGQYAELKDNQKKVMGAVNKRKNILVLRASIKLDSDEFVDIKYSTIKSDSDAKTGYRLLPFELSD
jgi:hypothetical protein